MKNVRREDGAGVFVQGNLGRSGSRIDHKDAVRCHTRHIIRRNTPEERESGREKKKVPETRHGKEGRRNALR